MMSYEKRYIIPRATVKGEVATGEANETIAASIIHKNPRKKRAFLLTVIYRLEFRVQSPGLTRDRDSRPGTPKMTITFRSTPCRAFFSPQG